MDQILNTVESFLAKAMVFVNENLLLVAGLGLVLLLLILMAMIRGRRSRYTQQDGEIEFLEVGPEPVIVYRRAEEHESSQEPEATPSPEPEPEPEPESEPEPELTVAALESEAETELELEQPELVRDSEPDPLPFSQPELPPQPVFDPEPEPEPEVADDPPPASSPPPLLPYLESELANDTLNFFSAHGYDIEKIVYQGVYGADFIATSPGIRAYVQVKGWKKKIAENNVLEVYGYANNHDCNQIILVSASNFPRAAAKAAARIGVKLWNRKTLKRLEKKPLKLDEAAATRD